MVEEPGHAPQAVVLVRVGVLDKLDIALLQLLGQQHRVLEVDIVIRHPVIQHPLLVPQIVNSNKPV